ncbi:MAG: single-stranded DNA-binding protein [Ignavibacterium sp.]
MADLRMPEINYVIIAGNLTKDPVYRTTTNNTSVVNFTIASNRKFKDSSNQWQEDVCYVGIVAWNKLAESCKDRLKKGSAVLIDGELQSRTWKNDDGNTRNIVEIKARRIQFLNRKLKNNEQNGEEEVTIFDEESENNNYTEDSFNKFLTSEESNLINGETKSNKNEA